MNKGLLLDASTQNRREIGLQVAELWYRLQTPGWDETYITRFTHKIWINTTTKQAVIIYSDTETIPLRTHNQDGTNWGRSAIHIAEWVDLRFPGATQAQIDWMKGWIKDNDSCTIDQLILENGGTPVNLPGLPAWAEVVNPDDLFLSTDPDWEEYRGGPIS